MASPLPGMNPYLEQPELWSEFHSRMIVAIADTLDELLSRDYRVAVAIKGRSPKQVTIARRAVL